MDRNECNFLTAKEAAEFLSVTIGMLYKLVFQRRLPCYKPNGGRLYFDRAELEAWIRRGRVTPSDELDDKAVEYCQKDGRAAL